MLGLEMIERIFINLVIYINVRIFKRNFNNDYSIVFNIILKNVMWCILIFFIFFTLF